MTIPETSYLQLQKDGSVLVTIHVMPNAARTQIQGLHDGAIKIRLHAPPVDGKANAALTQWLAELLDVPRQSVTLIRGMTSRRKQLAIGARHVADAKWERLQASMAAGDTS